MDQTPANDVANAELLSLVPPHARRIVEIGCMLGAMAREVRNRSPGTEFVGIDIDPAYVAAPAEHCTETFTCDIETIEPALWETLFPSDCWIFGDCLVLSQRRITMRWPAGDKPLVSRVPLSWIPGFHQALEGSIEIPGLYLLHFRFFDLDAALAKGGHYRASKWNPDDLSKGLGGHQLAGEASIVSQFQDWSHSFAQLEGASFDRDAELSVVPDWMREAIFV